MTRAAAHSTTDLQPWGHPELESPVRTMMIPVIGIRWITRAAQLRRLGNRTLWVALSAPRTISWADQRMTMSTVKVATAAIGSIVYKSASFTIISLKGSGTTAHPETSSVLFQVLDQSGGAKAGASVTFSLDTSVGGISVNAGPIVSDAN